MMETITLEPDAFNHRDIEMLSDMICDILSERYDVVAESLSFLSFSVEVSFIRDEEAA